jgi:hypothetical protein
VNNLAVATSLATSPFSAFAELRERPRFWFPLLAVLLSSVAILVWYYSVVDIEWMKDAMYSANPDFQKMAPEQRAAAMAFVGRNTMMIGGAVGICVAIPFFCVVIASYYLLAARVTKIPLGFRHWFALTCWSALPALLGAVVAAIFLLIRDSDQVGPGILQPLGLNELFFHRPLGSKPQAFLDALNIPGMLGWVLAIIGVRAWSARSWLFSAIFVLIPVVLLYGIWGWFAFK